MARIIGKGYSFDDILIVPKYNRVRSRTEVKFQTKFTKNHGINIPLIAANMETVCESSMAITIGQLGGVGVIHRFMSIEKEAQEVRLVRDAHLLAAASVGSKDYAERLQALISAGAEVIVIDVAHGHTKYIGEILAYIKTNYPKIDVMVGNIATKDAAEYFISKGADALKVGIGPGSLCITRVMTGAGVPQITAIMDVYEATQGRIPICADGGIRSSGDIAKAIGAGADTVMLGSLFAGTKETPGPYVQVNGEQFKEYMGSASYAATIKRLERDGQSHKEIISVEGERKLIPFKGPVEPIAKKLLGGLASAMTYMGADTIDKIRGKADFIEMSDAGRTESGAHGLEK